MVPPIRRIDEIDELNDTPSFEVVHQALQSNHVSFLCGNLILRSASQRVCLSAIHDMIDQYHYQNGYSDENVFQRTVESFIRKHTIDKDDAAPSPEDRPLTIPSKAEMNGEMIHRKVEVTPLDLRASLGYTEWDNSVPVQNLRERLNGRRLRKEQDKMQRDLERLGRVSELASTESQGSGHRNDQMPLIGVGHNSVGQANIGQITGSASLTTPIPPPVDQPFVKRERSETPLLDIKQEVVAEPLTEAATSSRAKRAKTKSTSSVNTSTSLSRTQGSTTPDIVIYIQRPGKPPIIFCIIELKWVRVYSSGLRETTFKFRGFDTGLFASAFLFAVRECVYQVIWYLYMASALNKADMAIAQINEFFFRIIRLPDGTFVVESCGQDAPQCTSPARPCAAGSAPSTPPSRSAADSSHPHETGSNASGSPDSSATATESAQRATLNFDAFDTHETFWDSPPNSLIDRSPVSGSVPDSLAASRYSTMLYKAFFHAATCRSGAPYQPAAVPVTPVMDSPPFANSRTLIARHLQSLEGLSDGAMVKLDDSTAADMMLAKLLAGRRKSAAITKITNDKSDKDGGGGEPQDGPSGSGFDGGPGEDPDDAKNPDDKDRDDPSKESKEGSNYMGGHQDNYQLNMADQLSSLRPDTSSVPPTHDIGSSTASSMCDGVGDGSDLDDVDPDHDMRSFEALRSSIQAVKPRFLMVSSAEMDVFVNETAPSTSVKQISNDLTSWYGLRRQQPRSASTATFVETPNSSPSAVHPKHHDLNESMTATTNIDVK